MVLRVPLAPGVAAQLTGVTDPSQAQDAATKNYVDTHTTTPGIGYDSGYTNLVIDSNSITNNALLSGTLTSIVLNALNTQTATDLVTYLTDVRRLNIAKYQFVGSSVAFSISAASASGALVTCTIPGAGAVFTPNVLAGTIVQIYQIQNVTDVALAGNLTGAVSANPLGNQTLTITATTSGGGAFSSVSSIWTLTGVASKNAYTTSPIVNASGITISLIAQSISGTLAPFTVLLNGVALTNTYTASGTFPNYVLTIGAGDLSGNAIETAATVTVALSNSTFSLTSNNNLTNIQPVPFSTVLTGAYSITSAPYYRTTANITFSYTNAGAITGFNGVFTPGGNATTATGTLPNVVITGSTISGSATGVGTLGAGSSTVTLSGSVAAVPTYTPAFYQQSSSATVPLFTTVTAQTSTDPLGVVITYGTASLNTDFNWVATTYAANRVFLVTPLGTSVLVPDVTSAVTISGISFTVLGWTSLVVGTASQLTII